MPNRQEWSSRFGCTHSLRVSIGGKLLGAYGGAQIASIRDRNAGVMATLMNTRGLTELVILGVGLQLHMLNKPLYSLMVIMALVTTAMSGPLLKAIAAEGHLGVPVTTAPGSTVGPFSLLNTAARAGRPSPRGVSGRPGRPPNMHEPRA